MNSQILFAVAILGGLGIFFGAMLALVARFFAVHTEPRIDTVREALPGANCGACGYASCTNFAEAVVEGKAPLNGCIPGGGDTSRELGAIMGREPGEALPKVATVFCAGDRGKARDTFIYDGIKDCALARNYSGGHKECPEGCLGLGSCSVACPFEAIRMGPLGLPVVNFAKCNGCGLCARACPRGIIQLKPKREQGHLILCNSHARGKEVSRACDAGCIACNACVKACPREAIVMENNLAVIDLDKCDDCGACVLKCRPGTIHPRAHTGAARNKKAAAAVPD